MKKITILAIAFLATGTIAMAQPPEGNANVGDVYGAKTSASNAIAIEKVPAMLEKKSSFNGKVKAKILDVCPKKGCWLKLAVNDSTTAFVKMKDYGFFLPTAAIGKTVVLDGEVKLLETPVSELQHYAKDAKKSQAEIDAITQPKKEIRFTAKGIVVVDK